MAIKKKKNSNHLIKVLSILLAFFAVILLGSCTKSFCTNQDNANRLYSKFGNIYALDVEATDSSVVVQNELERGLQAQKTNRITLYNFVTQSVSINRTTGYSYPMPDRRFYQYMNNKVDKFVSDKYTLWTNGTIDKLSETKAKEICYHVAIYAGVENNMVSDLYRNMNNWYLDAINDLGYDIVPARGYIDAMQTGLNLLNSNSTACISPENKEYNMDSSIIYIQGKTWGQAFKEYGFLEGLFVWPFASLVHVISTNLSNSGWAQILAITVVTLLVRSLSIVSTVLQTRSQERTRLIQPELNALASKYPNADTDKQQKQAMTLERMQLMRKAKTHPFRPFLFMILQFPLFICVWSALQGSAALASGRWLGVSLTTTVQSCFSSFSSTPGALTGLIVFFITCAMSIASNLSNMAFNKWKQDKGIIAQMQSQGAGSMDPNRTTKIMSYVFIVFYIFMSYRLPVGMNIYFYLGSVLTVTQTIILEAIGAKKRHNQQNNTGDGSDLASLRRSSKHRLDNTKKKKEKALWR